MKLLFFVALNSYSYSLSESLELLDSLSDDSEATSSPRPKALVSSSSSLSNSSAESLSESEDDSSEIVWELTFLERPDFPPVFFFLDLDLDLDFPPVFFLRVDL